jgi:hypothetical protein
MMADEVRLERYHIERQRKSRRPTTIAVALATLRTGIE